MRQKRRWMNHKNALMTFYGFLNLSEASPASAAVLSGALGYTNQLQSASLEIQLFELDALEKLKLGLGARSTFFRSAGARFSTAEPSEIASQKIEDVDSNALAVISSNAMIFAEYQLTEVYALAANVDAIGFSFGSAIELSKGGKLASATPSSFNLLIFDQYDRGTLNSHFMIRRKIEDNMVLSLGLAHQFVEYKSSVPFDFDNRRFRLKSNAVVVSMMHSI